MGIDLKRISSVDDFFADDVFEMMPEHHKQRIVDGLKPSTRNPPPSESPVAIVAEEDDRTKD